MKPLYVVISLCLCMTIGCSKTDVTEGIQARANVIANNAVDKIDHLLGILDVKREKIELKAREAEAMINDIREAKHMAIARTESLTSDIAILQGKISKIDSKLRTIRPYVKQSGDTIKIGVNTYGKAELEKATESLLTSHESYVLQRDEIISSRDIIRQISDDLQDRQTDAVDRLSRVSTKLVTVDAKKKALESMRVAAPLGAASLSEKLSELEKEVNDLAIEISGKTGAEAERFNKDKTVRDIEAIKSPILKDIPASDDLMTRLDKILKD